MFFFMTLYERADCVRLHYRWVTPQLTGWPHNADVKILTKPALTRHCAPVQSTWQAGAADECQAPPGCHYRLHNAHQHWWWSLCMTRQAQYILWFLGSEINIYVNKTSGNQHYLDKWETIFKRITTTILWSKTIKWNFTVTQHIQFNKVGKTLSRFKDSLILFPIYIHITWHHRFCFLVPVFLKRYICNQELEPWLGSCDPD